MALPGLSFLAERRGGLAVRSHKKNYPGLKAQLSEPRECLGRSHQDLGLAPERLVLALKAPA